MIITYDDDGYLVSFRQPIGNSNQITGYDLYNLKYDNGGLVEITSTTSLNIKKVNFKDYDEANQDALQGHKGPANYNG